jgi:hypothetical protein
MRRRANILLACSMMVSLAALVAVGCSPADGGGNGGVCDTFTNYKATVTTAPSFATDIMPILSDENATNGCGRAVACHGNPPSPIDSITNPMKYLQFVFDPPDPAMAKAQLMMASLNAPSMQRVVPGNVGQSVMAYKLAADRTGLACINAMCVSGASVGNNVPCGDLMPSTGQATFDAAKRTKILDWIALGAKD